MTRNYYYKGENIEGTDLWDVVVIGPNTQQV